MLGLLRFVGVLNAAVWLGSVVCFTVVTAPALSSAAASNLYGAQFFPYFSVATLQLILERFYYLNIACALIALGHLYIERLYAGRGANRMATGLLLGLLTAALLGGAWINPKLTSLHQARHARNTTPAMREAATSSARVWRGLQQALNLLLLAGTVGHLWRLTNTADTPRFVSPGKFRG